MAWLVVAWMVMACVSVGGVVGTPKQMSGAESLRKQVTPVSSLHTDTVVELIDGHCVRLFSVPTHSGTVLATSEVVRLTGLTSAPGVVEPIMIVT